VSNLFDRRAKCTNFKLVGGQIEIRGEGNGEWVSPSPADKGVRGRVTTENEFWRILELEKTHLIDTNLSFLTFLEELAGWI